MKKRFFFGVLAVLGMTACSQDEVLDVNRNGDEITFNVVTNKASRANKVHCNNDKPGSFNVWAKFATDGNVYIDGDNIASNDGTNWTNNSGTRYWPDGALNFYAYANDNTTSTFRWNNGNPKFEGFTVGTALNEQKDLLYAVTLNKSQTTSSTSVALNFRHALSQIVFKAKNSSNHLNVSVTGVSIVNVFSQGTFKFPTTATDDKVGTHNGNGTTLTTGLGTWESQSTKVTYAATFSSVPVNSSTAVPLTDVVENDDVSVNENWTNVMLLVPQTLTAWNPSKTITANDDNTTGDKGAYFKVTCVINNVANNGTSDVLTEIHDGDIYIPVPANTEWEQGKKYIYTFNFGNGNGGYDNTGKPILVPITFTVTVDDFIAVAEKYINMTTTP